MTARLKTTNAYAEAARVLLDYGRDVEGSITASCEGSDFREAIRIVSLYKPVRSSRLTTPLGNTVLALGADRKLNFTGRRRRG